MKQNLAPPAAPLLEAVCEEETLESEREPEPVLTISLRYPKLTEERKGARRISRYYQHMAETLKARWKKEFYLAACADCTQTRAISRPFEPWHASLDFSVTLLTPTLLSLTTTATERFQKGRPAVVLRGDTWELPGGMPVALRSLYPDQKKWKNRLLDEILDQGRTRLQRGESLWYEDWETRAVRAFDPEHFYLTDENVVLFYPLCSIAPYLERFVTFSCPRPGVTLDPASGA